MKYFVRFFVHQLGRFGLLPGVSGYRDFNAALTQQKRNIIPRRLSRKYHSVSTNPSFKCHLSYAKHSRESD
jgi:hypothetical protein